jgi:hypothetical protein
MLYSGNLLTQTAWDGSFRKARFLRMAIMAPKILTIRLIKLWKRPCRIIEIGDQPLAPITEALHDKLNFR